jgi:hypothetical protein
MHQRTSAAVEDGSGGGRRTGLHARRRQGGDAAGHPRAEAFLESRPNAYGCCILSHRLADQPFSSLIGAGRWFTTIFEFAGDLWGKPVPQRVKHSPKRIVGYLPSLQMHLLLEILEPRIGLVGGETGDACRAYL